MKVPRSISREEQETVIRANANDREWEFCTRDPKFMRRLVKRGYEVRDHQGFWSCKIPLSRISIRKLNSRVGTNSLGNLRNPQAVEERNTLDSPDDVRAVPEKETREIAT